MNLTLTRQDALFLVDTLIPEARDPAHAADNVRTDPKLLESMLDDDRLFTRMVSSEEMLVRVSPWLFFTVLLRRAGRDLEHEHFTVERRSQQKLILFDADRVAELLQRPDMRDYLASLLASFARVRSEVVPIRVRTGVWTRIRINELDVESLMRYAGVADAEVRFDVYRRIGDVCLFLTGMFPDFIEARHRYHRPALRGEMLRGLEDYEGQGQTFYRMAAEHDRARSEGLSDVLDTLSEKFVLAEKPIAFLADRYLRFTRDRLFEV